MARAIWGLAAENRLSLGTGLCANATVDTIHRLSIAIFKGGDLFDLSQEFNFISVFCSLSGISGLSFDSTLLSPLSFLCLVLTLSVLSFFPARWPILLNFFQKILQYFSLRDRLFLGMAPV